MQNGDAGSGWEYDEIASDEDGLVFFDGGTYSRGPSVLVDAGDEEGEEGRAEEGPEGWEESEDGEEEDSGQLGADKDRLERQLSLEVGRMLLTKG
jgi:hypothetical protein